MLKRHIEYVQFQGISTMSKLIKKWTRDNDSHSAVLDRERMSHEQLIEQWPHEGGFKSWMDYNSFSPGHTTGTPYQVWSLKVEPHVYDYVMGKYRESADNKKPYDWSGIKAFALKGEDNPEQTFCSEEMSTHLIQAMANEGQDHWSLIDPAVVHPGYWRNILIAMGAQPTIKGVV